MLKERSATTEDKTMKRDLRQLTPGYAAKIKVWLESDTPELNCPFVAMKRRQQVCHGIFPKLGYRHVSTTLDICPLACPCRVYGLKYVRRIARQVIKEVNHVRS